jgi:deoxycytidine triphosphate deaminase
MILNSSELLAHLTSGHLVVDLLLDEAMQIAGHAITLRLGTEFAEFPAPAITPSDLSVTSEPPLPAARTFSVGVGNPVVLQPSAGLLATTLEYVAVPEDLFGLVFPRAWWARVGLSMPSSIIHPGFGGRIVVPVHNVGRIPVVLYPGLRLLNISLVQTTAADTVPRTWYANPDAGPRFEVGVDAEIPRLKELLVSRTKRLRSTAKPTSQLRRLLDQATGANETDRGKALERFAVAVFHTVNGLKIIKTNARLKAEELDVYLHNNISQGFWRLAGSPILVECKNLAGKVGAREIGTLFDKLKSISPDARTAILVAPSGVSSDALTKVREKRQQGIYILILELTDLEDIASGSSATDILERSYNRVLLL